MANFKVNSRYTNGFRTKNRSGKDFLVLRGALNLSQDAGDIFVTITQDLTGRPDLISNKVYQSPDLWWVILEFNNISDPLFELRIGQIIRLPSIDRVLAAISNLGNT